MASKRRLRRKGCEGKIRHETYGEAAHHRRRLRKPDIDIYHCRFCGGWHVGHPGSRRLRKRRMYA